MNNRLNFTIGFITCLFTLFFFSFIWATEKEFEKPWAGPIIFNFILIAFIFTIASLILQPTNLIVPAIIFLLFNWKSISFLLILNILFAFTGHFLAKEILKSDEYKNFNKFIKKN